MLTNVLPANTYPRIPPPPGDGVKSSKFNFFKHFDLTYTPSIWVWLKSDIEIVQNLTAIPGVASSIPARYHTFVEIDHEIISTVILLPSADLFKKGCCQLQAKVCAQITG